jgi:hypothetical protein
MRVETILTPLGILEVDSDQLNILFGTSRETSDFIADALEQWWEARQSVHPDVRRLLIDLDNGPNVASSPDDTTGAEPHARNRAASVRTGERWGS